VLEANVDENARGISPYYNFGALGNRDQLIRSKVKVVARSNVVAHVGSRTKE